MAAGNTLRNEDFRKLLATPAASRSGDYSSVALGQSASAGFTHKQAKSQDQKNKKKSKYRPPNKEKKELSETDQLFNESDARLHEILGKYRDRAAERRKGEVDGQDIELRAKLTSGLQAFRDDDDSIDRREQEIRESKFLGGDIEHTHLVKGLDYSLLNKTRSEIKEHDVVEEEDQDMEKAFQNPVSKHALLNDIAKSKFSRAICKTLFEPLPLTKNELFQRGRMAYVVELDDEQTEVPVTLLRSTFECVNDKSEQNMNANNMLINKLTEVLSYLRSDGKRKRKEAVKEVAPTPSMPPPSSSNKKDSIYDDVAEYNPSRDSKSSRSDRDSRRDDRRNYFDDNRRNRDRDYDREKDHNRDRRDRDRERDSRRSDRDERTSRSDRERRSEPDKKQKVEHNPFPRTSSVLGTLPAEEPKPKKSKLDQEDAYGELFPSSEMYYGGSDDEEDFSKMDMGNKKGPVNRWDFENNEDYEKYMSTREANPKAAFQFGVKANSGRKTRKNNAAAMEKKFDKELEKIEGIWKQKKTSKPNY